VCFPREASQLTIDNAWVDAFGEDSVGVWRCVIPGLCTQPALQALVPLE
jgi:hypothetical protein